MTSNSKGLARGLIWLLGFSGLPLGVIGVLVVERFIWDGVILLTTFFCVLVGMVLLAEKLDKKLKIGFFKESLIQ